MDMKYYWLQTESAKSNLIFTGAQVRTTLEITIPKTFQRNITKIWAESCDIKLTA
jgi:hypothetical protein